MPVKGATRADIESFLGQKRIAVVGVSRHENEYSRMLFRELARRGYDVAPVNPEAREVEGARCFARIADVAPAVEGALVLLPSAAAETAVRECVEAGVKQIWSRRDVPGASELCREQDVSLVTGVCPFMFLPHGAIFHQCHALTMRLVGRYPA